MWDDWGPRRRRRKLEVAGKVKVSGAGNGIMSGNVQITTPGKGIVVQSPRWNQMPTDWD